MADAPHDPQSNTVLAMQRNLMASERTLMAWIRTSLSLIGFGFTLTKVFRTLAEENVFVSGPAGHVWTPEAVGMVLLFLGNFALVGAIVNHHNDLKQLKAAGLKVRRSLTTAVASVLVIVGTMALLSVTVHY